MTYIDDMNEIIKSFTEYRQSVQEKLKKEFKAVITKLFEENSELKAIVWEQYTPYFNDGNTCYFALTEVVFTNATGDDLDLISYGGYDGENEDVCVFSEYREVERLMVSSGMEDVMLAMFGDHVRVVATREGFSISRFDHD
jgi:hypothetical protein